MSTDVDIHTLVGAYALDAVSDIERAAFDRHLAVCESCAQETAELRETVVRLTDATSTAPPRRLKESVLGSARRTRQLPPQLRAARVPASRGWRGWAVAAAAAVVIAVAAGVGGFAVSNHRVGTVQSRLDAASAQNARMTSILSAPDARVHTEHVQGGGDVTVIVSRRLNQGVAVLASMPALSTARAYELWLVHGTTPVPAGLMRPGQVTGVSFFSDVNGADAFGVSNELARGAASPAEPLVTSFALT